MTRLLIRFFGLVLLAGGFVALIVDGTASLAGGALYLTSLHGALQGLSPQAAEQLRLTLLGRFPSFVWGALLAILQTVPVSLALCAAGALLIMLSHKHRQAIGYLTQ